MHLCLVAFICIHRYMSDSDSLKMDTLGWTGPVLALLEDRAFDRGIRATRLYTDTGPCIEQHPQASFGPQMPSFLVLQAPELIS